MTARTCGTFVPNLIHVKPYHFFKHTGDINAPPGLEKREKDEGPVREAEVSSNNTEQEQQEEEKSEKEVSSKTTKHEQQEEEKSEKEVLEEGQLDEQAEEPA